MKENNKNIHYFCGSAFDRTFLNSIFEKRSFFDCIVDFMDYGDTKLFELNINIMKKHTKQYMYLSSARVYAGGDTIITENFPRLYDITDDVNLLESEDYPIHKAKQEDIVKRFSGGDCNYTIIRPYITYNDYRLQSGVLEKEQWLYRALSGRTIIMPEAIVDKYTTLTSGNDVAMVIFRLIGNKKAYNQIFHIADAAKIKWRNVLNIYIDVFNEAGLGKPKIKIVEDINEFCKYTGRTSQIKYDRIFDREFDNSKVESISGLASEFYTEPEKGLRHCLENFINNPCFRRLSVNEEAYFDRLCNEKMDLSDLAFARKIKYLLARYMNIFL